MNHRAASSSCSSASPPALQQQPARSSSSSTNTHSTPTPAIIPLDYDYQTMSPSSLSQLRQSNVSTSNTSNIYHLHHRPHSSRISSARPPPSNTTTTAADANVDLELDTQYSSLFGDPVPPPPPLDFLTTHFEPPQLQRPVSLDISSGDEDGFGRTVTLGTGRAAQTRLFSNVPFSSAFSRRVSDASSQQRNFDVLPTPMPRLQPPDIQILPNSSGGSSSDTRDSPNYALLAPSDILRRPTVYDIGEPADVSDIVETITISDASGRREYTEATRRVSNFAEDFKSNVGALSNNQESDITAPHSSAAYSRQFSNESYSSNEWFRPATHDYPEFSKIPRLRPSSKNVMSIKRDEMPMHHSPVAAMINDSNGSSSGEERLMNTTQTLECPSVSLDGLTPPPARPPDPSPSLLREMEADLQLSPQSFLRQRRLSSVDSLSQHFPTPPPPAAPPPPDIPSTLPEESEGSIKREMSPVILRDSIVTGSEHRVDQPRLHKKTSFTIISEKSPQSSRAQSPSSALQSQRSPSKASVPSGSTLIKPVAKPRNHLQQKSLSSTQLRLPQLPQLQQQMPSDDSPRPSVQFNMTGRYTPSKMPQRSILHHRESLTSSQDTTPLPHSIAATPTAKRRQSTLPPSVALTDGHRMKSCETLPLITDPYRTAIPRLNRTSLDLRERELAVFPPGALPRPLKPNPNPTRKQKGLLRILNGEISHIPLRSNWASMDDLTTSGKQQMPLPATFNKGLESRRRSSSTSPERRSSTQTASDRRSSNLSSVTTSDFSFRRPSITPQLQQQRRKSIFPVPSPQSKRRQSLIVPSKMASGRTSRTKIAKPTTLSPIIGTPNKDSSEPQSPEQNATGSLAASETPSETNSRRDSLSQIPVRPSNLQPSSRNTSPLKEFTAQLPLSGTNSGAPSSRTASRATMYTDSRASSRATSRPVSRSASRPGSRPTSRPASRSTSRASTRPISRAASRTSTRPNSRMEMAKAIANSRSNSRLRTHSTTARAESVSPNVARRRGSVTASPMVVRRRKSISLSPKSTRRAHSRRQSLSPPNKKRSGSRGRDKNSRSGPTESRRNSLSRIPLRASSGGGKTQTSPKAKPRTASRPKSRTPMKAALPASARRGTPTRANAKQQKKPVSAKGTPSTVPKRESSIRRTPSSLSKQPAAATMKRQPSNLQKSGSGSNLKREASNLQKKSTTATGVSKPVRRETTSIGIKKPATAAAKATPKGGLKRQTSSKSLAKVGTATVKAATDKPKTADDKMTTSAAEVVKTNEASKSVNDDAAAMSANIITTAEKTAAASTSAAVVAVAVAGAGVGTRSSGSGSGGSATATSTRRHPSNVSLVRMASKMSLFSVKRSDSNLSKKIKVSPVAEEPAQQVAGVNGQVAPLQKVNSRGQLMTPEEVAALPAAILEKSQKTLENIQKTVSDATDEIQKTIHDNLTDLKSLESDMGRLSDSAGSPTSSVTTVVENRQGKTTGASAGGESVSRTGTAEGATATAATAKQQTKNGSGSGTTVTSARNSPLPPAQPIEADVSVLNAPHTEHGSSATNTGAADSTGQPHADMGDAAAERNYIYDIADTTTDGVVKAIDGERLVDAAAGVARNAVGGDDDIKRRSPDGQGGSTAGSGNGSREFLKEPDDDSAPPSGCCRCCTKFCMPCRRSRCSRCCRRNKSKPSDESEEPVLSATSSATTTNLEVIDEAAPSSSGKKSKTSCWQKLNCCKRCRKKPKVGDASDAAAHEAAVAMTAAATAAAPTAAGAAQQQRGCCGRCLSKLFCCRRVNKVDAITGSETELQKCCYCIPCRGAKQNGRGAAVGSTSSSQLGAAAWQDPERGITPTDASVVEGARDADALPKQGCCSRFCGKFLCCRRKQLPAPSDSRRASMKAPPPPAEDTRRKLHVDLVEYNSKMKGAIPVLPLYLAWFCAICNTVLPGLGTLLSGLFCICVGIPRFSQYDSAKARFGSFIINIIVAVSQLFCVLFCFVGWGWSIWWGTIMLKCARKLNRIKKVERLEMEEEKRQAEAAAAAAVVAARVVPPVTTTMTTETEAAK